MEKIKSELIAKILIRKNIKLSGDSSQIDVEKWIKEIKNLDQLRVVKSKN